MTAEELVELFERELRQTANEAMLQLQIASLLERERVEFQREFRLSKRDRIDFMVGSIGVEVKIAGSPSAVTRQLFRYTEVEAVKELVLVTSKGKLACVPDEMNGKRILVAALRGFF